MGRNYVLLVTAPMRLLDIAYCMYLAYLLLVYFVIARLKVEICFSSQAQLLIWINAEFQGHCFPLELWKDFPFAF